MCRRVVTGVTHGSRRTLRKEVLVHYTIFFLVMKKGLSKFINMIRSFENLDAKNATVIIFHTTVFLMVFSFEFIIPEIYQSCHVRHVTK